MTKPRVLLLELNELCPPLLERFMAEGALPTFSRFYSESEIFTTDAEEDPPNLEPWIQWVTVHTGLPLSQHGVFHLGDAQKLRGHTIADLASAHGRRVWLCGSMNIRYRLPLHGAVLPDMWNTDATPYPKELVPVTRFLQLNVQEHSNAKVPLTPAQYWQAASFFATHGLSFESVVAVMRQLAGEVTNGDRWKRAMIVDRLYTDLFSHYYKRHEPHFATLFLNTVAHYQHKFWRNMEPDRFTLKPSLADQSRYRDAILCAHRSFDRVMASLLRLVAPDTTVILCSALSQQPYLRAEKSGGKRFYRPHRFDDLAAALGIAKVEKFLPVMSEQFHVFFGGDELAAKQAEALLASYRVAGRPLFEVERRGAEIFTGCKIHDVVLPENVHIEGGNHGRFPVRFYDLFYLADSLKSGFHHRDGVLWIRRPSRRHALHQGRVPLRAVAPTIVDLLQLPRPAGMKESPLLAA